MNISLEELLESIAEDWATMKLPDPDLYQLWEGIRQRQLWLEDPICWHTVSRIYKYIQTLDSKDQTPVVINIFSPGGELDVMFALYHLIKTSPIPIHTVNVGRCHSAAFIVFLAGSVRTMTPYGTFIAHEGSGVVGGSYRETKAAMAQYDKDVEKMCRIIADETNLEYEYIKKRFSEDQDWYIGYEEAVETGVIRDENAPLF